MLTAGVIIIGNEILNGHVTDGNSLYAAKSLLLLGHKLRKISVIPDEVDIISKEVSAFSREYDIVITSGGIGPTHDDVTFEGVAAAFGDVLYQHPDLTKKLIKFFNLSESSDSDDKTEPKLKLAKFPKSARLTYGSDAATGKKIPYPVVSVRNVHILPGIPSLFRKGLNIIKKQLMSGGKLLYSDSIYISLEESTITNALNVVVKEFENVLFGSYPVFYNNFYKVQITMESSSEKTIQEASSRLKSLIGQTNISNYDPQTFVNSSSNVFDLSQKDTTIGKKVLATSLLLEEAFKRYQPNEVVLAFTGGKDCTVLLHFIYAFLKRRPSFSMIRLLFFRTKPSFPEVEDFIKNCLHNYEVIPPHGNFIEYNGPIKESLWSMKKDHPEIKAVIMGTKRKDPNGINLTAFNNTTPGWPDYCLINPILDWSYGEIWEFLIGLCVPYCCLYDRGYTSIGGIDNTLPNPKLLYVDSHGQQKYHPAFYLKEEDTERDGRFEAQT